MSKLRTQSLLRLLAVLLGFTLIAAACGDDSSEGSDTDTTDSSDPADEGDDMSDEGDDMSDEGDDMSDEGDDTSDEGDDMSDEGDDTPLTASYTGVSEDTITLGIAMLDFEDLVSKNLSPAGWGDQQAVWDALITDLNDRGGVNGRLVEPVYEFYTPIDPADATRACTALTEDNEVFAVLGGFVGPLAGTVDPCITGLNNTILVGGDQNAEELGQSTAPWYQPGQSGGASTEILIGLLADDGALDGAKVFVVGGQADEAGHQPSIDALTDAGVEIVGDDIMIAPDGDTAAQDDELQIITERIKEDAATAVFIHGNPSAVVRGLAAAGLITELDVWANNPSGLNNIGETIVDRSVVNGVVTASGPPDEAIWDDPLYQSQCNDVAAAALPEADVRPPLDYAEDEENWFNPIRRYCRHLDLFVQIATAAGNELNHETFTAGAESLTDFSLPGSPNASLGPDKLYAEDRYALAVYDSEVGDGQAVPVGDLVDIFQ